MDRFDDMLAGRTQSDRDRETCQAKLTWRTRESAVAARAYAAWQYGGGTSRPEPYRCRHCGLWHLARSRYEDAD